MATMWAYNLAVPPSIYSDAQFTNLLISKQAEFQSITTVPDPTLPTSAANKEYVDAHGGGNPGLPLNSVQYNSSGTFAGSSDLLWDQSLKTLTVNGDVIAQNHLSVSDVMLKNNIMQLSNDQSLELLSKIECYKYNLLDSDTETYGVMAQQLENIGLKNIVNQGADFKSVAYIQLLPLIIASLKKLNEKVEGIQTFKPFTSSQPPPPFQPPLPQPQPEPKIFEPYDPDESKIITKKFQTNITRKKRRSVRR